LHCAWYHEIDKIINGEDLHLELRKRRKGFGLRFFKDLEMLDTGSANFFWHTYTQTHADQNSQNVRGLVVCKGAGVVKGVVKILLDPAKVETFNEGDVLLAPMTSPEYIFAMKKAAAIVTDEGGLTSHAAIVSRELGIPCIVGTKIATKIFRDGDVVEIFPELGEVRKT
jgi:phosphoenolpyruvate synthase/pyruvate phosphate dikinase